MQGAARCHCRLFGEHGARAWVSAVLGVPLLAGCGQQAVPNAHQGAPDVTEGIRAFADVARARTSLPELLEIVGYDRTGASDDDEEPPVAILCDADKFRLSIRASTGGGPNARAAGRHASISIMIPGARASRSWSRPGPSQTCRGTNR